MFVLPLQPCFGSAALNKLADLPADTAHHGEEFLARLSDFSAEEIHDAEKLNAVVDGKADPATQAVLDRGRSVQIFSYDPRKGFAEQIRFDVYEKKMHERRGGTGARSPVIRDFDGDGKADLAILVHDRLIVYPQ